MLFTIRVDGEASGTPFGSLLLAVFNSILEVVLQCLAGYILAQRGILDKKTQKQLNRLNVSLFTPALLFSKVALYLTPAKLKELYVIPIYFVIVTGVSMLVGSVLGWAFNLKTSQRSFVTAAAMFMNSNALPIALMQSLVPAVPALKWGPDDDKNVMLGRALTYLTMYSTLGMVVRYSYGIKLLARADTVAVPVEVRSATRNHDETAPLLEDVEAVGHDSTSRSYETLRSRPSTSTIIGDSDEEILVASPTSVSAPLPTVPNTVPSRLQPNRRLTEQTTFYKSFPNSPNDSRADLSKYADSVRSTSPQGDTSGSGVPGEGTSLAPHHHHHHHHSRLHSIGRRIARAWAVLNDFMTVPLWAALLSLVVACVPPLQHALVYHLQPVNGAINTAGKCSVPLTLVVLGAYFYTPPAEKNSGEGDAGNLIDHPLPANSAESDGYTFKKYLRSIKSAISLHGYKNATPSHLKDQSKPGETKTVILAVAARMFITPVALLPLMALATRYDFHRVFEDPVFVVCNIILLASPPALTLAQITQAISGDAFERLISRTIFWSYCICTPPITILYVVLGLFLAKL